MVISSCIVCGYSETEILEAAAPVTAVEQSVAAAIENVAQSIAAQIGVDTEVEIKVVPQQVAAMAVEIAAVPVEGEETAEPVTATLNVFEMKAESEALEAAVPLHVYNVALVANGESVELKQSVTLSLPCDEKEADELRALTLVVVLPDGTLRPVEFTIVDGQIIFDTDVVGTFAFVKPELLEQGAE